MGVPFVPEIVQRSWGASPHGWGAPPPIPRAVAQEHPRLLRAPRAGPSLAAHPRPVRGARVRGDAPADPGLAGPSGIPLVPRALSDAPRARAGAARRGAPRLV